MDGIIDVVLFVAALVPAIVIHEVMHGVAAVRLGDLTPRQMGRLTLNPIPHIDPFGSVLLPGLLLLPTLFGVGGGMVFGYAKPMPVNPSNLKEPDRGMMWIALAGPAANLGLAVGFGLLSQVLSASGYLGRFLRIGLVVNVLLAVFNIMPIPPLDGSKVLARYLPPRAREVYRGLDQYGALFLLVIFFVFPGPILAIVTAVAGGIISILGG